MNFLPPADFKTPPTAAATNNEHSGSAAAPNVTSPATTLMTHPSAPPPFGPAMPSSSSLPPPPPTSDVPAYLTWRSHQYVTALNTRDPSLLDRSLVSPAFIDTSERATGREKQTLAQARAYMEAHVAAHPAYRVELLGTEVEVDARKGTAVVFGRIMHFGGGGGGGGQREGEEGGGEDDGARRLGLEGVSVCEYRRDREGRWVLMKHYGMRGVAPLPF